MTTEKLYFQDSHRSVFDAQVLSCEPWKDGWRIVLDRTVFFPEGGGQYADPGFLGEVEVVDVHEKDGVIYHYTKEPIEAGQKVEGRILWEVRFDRMQQHTGEHIISGLVHQKFGYDNVGFHLGEEREQRIRAPECDCLHRAAVNGVSDCFVNQTDTLHSATHRA